MRDAFRLDGLTALVTGASRGIGFAISQAYAAAGAALVLLARDRARLEEAASRIGSGRVWAVPGDLSRPEEIPTLFRKALAEAGGIDILVNNAGGILRGPAQALDPAELHRLIDLNLTAAYRLSCEFARERIAAGKPGVIVNISSILAELARPGVAAYAMTKAGLRQLTRALAVEWAPRGIRVNAVAPGFTRTELTRAQWSDPAREAAVKARTPLARWAEPQDIAHAACFLASPAAAFITGQTLIVDGGLTAAMGGIP
ncbi:MAG: glucose 1-dehydrogenase [Desulfobacterales bacterium]